MRRAAAVLAALAGVGALAAASSAEGRLAIYADLAFAGWIGLCAGFLAERLGAGRAATFAARAAPLLAGAALVALVPGARLIPWLGVAVANLAAAVIFLRGLRPGGRPLILQMVTVMGVEPEGTPAFRRFARGQCMIWAGMLAATALAACCGMAGVDLRPAAGRALGLLVGFQAIWFVASHEYAMRRHDRPESWLLTLRTLARPDAWTEFKL